MSGSEQRGAAPLREPADDMALELLAIEEQYMAQTRAGEQPRLAVYVARYPAHAAALVAWYASAHEPSPPRDAAPPTTGLNARPLTALAAMPQSPGAGAAPTGELPSAGMRRAVQRLFGAYAVPHAMFQVQNRVAEQPAPYGDDVAEQAAPVSCVHDPNDETVD